LLGAACAVERARLADLFDEFAALREGVVVAGVLRTFGASTVTGGNDPDPGFVASCERTALVDIKPSTIHDTVANPTCFTQTYFPTTAPRHV
jgi:hypothetical protein